MASHEPEYGRRLLTKVLDEVAESTPGKLYATIPLSDSLPYHFRELTFAEMARCIDFLANWLEERHGRSNTFETLAFIGIADLRGAVLFHAAVKLGYKASLCACYSQGVEEYANIGIKVLLMSHRNPPETNLSLMEQKACKILCFVAELQPVVETLRAIAGGKVSYTSIPFFDTMLESRPKHYFYRGTFENNENDPVLVLHSSGSTGLPKPIQMTNGTFTTMDNDRRLENIDGRKKQDFTIWDFPSPSKFYSSFPPFHLAGFLALVIVPVFSATATPVLGPPLRPPSGFLASDILSSQDIRALFVPPTIIEQLLDEPQILDKFQKMDYVCYAGGPLSQSAGDKLKDIVDLCQYYGATESSNIPQLLPSRENWAYMEWHPACNIEMQPRDLQEGTYEMVHFLDDSTRGHSPLNHNLPGVREWRSKDLFRRHPADEKLWQFAGRVDDIIVLSNGHKFNPVTAESVIQDHPLISGALIIGLGRAQAALLIELKADEPHTPGIVDMIWPVIEKANSGLPGQGRILRTKVLIAPAANRFYRTAKGTIVRKLTEKAFVTEIEALYSGSEEVIETEVPAWQAFEEEALRRLLHTMISRSLPQVSIRDQDDLFIRGLDSLKTLDVVQKIRAGLRRRLTADQVEKVSTRMVYQNPSIQTLASAISKLMNDDALAISDQQTGFDDRDRISAMSSMVEKYTQGLDRVDHDPHSHSKKDAYLQVALTGSTGSLGPHLLRRLLKHPKITRVWCLDRSDHAKDKHQTSPMLSQLDQSRISYHKIDPSQPHLGLPEETISALHANINLIIHNAWKIDFNQTLPSFEPQIHATRTLLNWTLTPPKHPRLVFISSISSVANYSPGLLVPSAPVSDLSAASRMGYAESKLVAETILHRAYAPVSVLRLGQIAPPIDTGEAVWPQREWLPALLKTSRSLGMVPRDLPPINWIPVDRLADIVGEIIDADYGSNDFRVYNIVNPNTVPWEAMLAVFLEACAGGRVVGLGEWLAELEGMGVDALGPRELAERPALKILPALREVKAAEGYDTARSVGASASLTELGPVRGERIR
ncbi:MAG: hypothetical protein Q9195_007195, partial [Heterodermia aff. obscurata]